MKTNADRDSEIQRRYYAETAREYNAMHVHERDEHHFALCMMLGAIDFLGVSSILDIGSGTGRAITYIKKKRPDILVRGIEPVQELREQAFSQGILPSELTDGNAIELQFDDGQFDMVCEFGALHHIRTPTLAVSEMLRVANKAIFISDSNNFGQGASATRILKQTINLLRLWPIANLIKTRGRGYTVSEGDGLAYSYSVMTNYRQIEKHCRIIHMFNTAPAGFNFYRSASHLALLGIKR